MKRGLLFSIAAIALSACTACDQRPEAAVKAVSSATSAEPTKQDAPASAKSPQRLHDPALAPLLANLKYKPDPYATQPGCISEPKSQQREQFVLWAELSLGRDGQGSVLLKDARYSVSTASLPERDETPESVGIPRLELVHRSGLVTRADFEGSYREPRSKEWKRSDDLTPRDPTWVLSWVASAIVTEDVLAHRIVLDGRVLQEVKRPDQPPRLSNIECDDTSADGLKLSWHAAQEPPQAPLLVEVLRFEGGGFVPLLPSTAAREVQGFTLSPADRKVAEDLVLLVTLTDTFRFVTRGVLVPRKAL